MSPVSLSFRSANVPEIASPVSKGIEKDTFTTTPLSGPIDVLKDTRAYELGRQRVKRAAELVKAKERKEAAVRRNNRGPRSDKPKSSIIRADKKTSWFAGKEVKGIWDNDNEKQLELEHPPTAITVTLEAESFQGEVKLADLVVSRKPRKIKEADFEVISPPRPVIVLDEFTMHDMDVDEPWEHVYAKEDNMDDAPSYAEIVSAAK
jgi:hypothetical protein